VADHRIATQCRHLTHQTGNGDQVAGVLHGLAYGSMVGMVVAGAMGQNQIGLETADLTDDLPAEFQGGFEPAVGEMPDLARGSDYLRGGGGFLSPAFDQFRPEHLVMPRLAVGDGDDLDHTPLL